MHKITKTLALIGAIGLYSCTNNPYSVDSKEELYEVFRYSPEKSIVISGHRGGMQPQYPENCLETFEKTLESLPAFYEIDPRLTKDSVIVLLHDATLDRTTSGTGKLKDYTYEEIQKLFLKDRDGNITTYKIPTLEEAIKWSQGETILNLDIKDVPLEMMADFINSQNVPNIMYTVRNADQARIYLDKDPGAMFSAWCKTMEEFKKYEAAGIPWGQMITYVGPSIDTAKSELYKALHDKGVMCMISVAPTHDKLKTDSLRIEKYEPEVTSGCDIIETDFPHLFKDFDLER